MVLTAIEQLEKLAKTIKDEETLAALSLAIICIRCYEEESSKKIVSCSDYRCEDK